MQRRVLILLAANLAALSLAVAGSEALLRLLRLYPPGTYATVVYDNDPALGPWPVPDQVASSRGACFQVPHIHINHLGMRDRERLPSAADRPVALLGDSFLQGLQVADEQTVSRLLEQALRRRVLNFGVSSVGTGIQLLIYRGRVRPFRPADVVLLFNAANDVEDNLQALAARNQPTMAAISPHFTLDAGGHLSAQPQQGLRRRTSWLLRTLSGSALGAQLLHLYRRGLEAHARSARADTVGTAALMEQGWRLTEQLLTELNAEVRGDGGRFLVAVVPDPLQQDASRAAALRVADIGRRAGFPVLDLAQAVTAGKPGDPQGWGAVRALSLSCDVHWGPQGHRAAALAIRQLLQKP